MESAPGVKRLFTVEEANRSLIYLRRVVSDLMAAYKKKLVLESKKSSLSVKSPSLDLLCEGATNELTRYWDEVEYTGAKVLRLEPLTIAFPSSATAPDRKVDLVWEPEKEQSVSRYRISTSWGIELCSLESQLSPTQIPQADQYEST